MSNVTFGETVHLLKNVFPGIEHQTRSTGLKNLLEHWGVTT